MFVGTGSFHPKAIALAYTGKIFVFNPVDKKFFLFDRKEAEKLKKKIRAALLKFHHASKIGVIISTKAGQNQYIRAQKLKKKYPDKEFYFIAFDTVDFSQLENFPFVEVFVNTPCNRLIDEYEKIPKPMINIDDIE